VAYYGKKPLKPQILNRVGSLTFEQKLMAVSPSGTKFILQKSLMGRLIQQEASNLAAVRSGMFTQVSWSFECQMCVTLLNACGEPPDGAPALLASDGRGAVQPQLQNSSGWRCGCSEDIVAVVGGL
jgi:hypothetical protein